MKCGLTLLKPELYMSMLETAEAVAECYKIGGRQDEYSLGSHPYGMIGARLAGDRGTPPERRHHDARRRR